jgi:hypothetical protein
MACKLLNVKKTAANCQENFSGVGTRVYVALADKLVDGSVVWSDEFAGFAASSFSTESFVKEGEGTSVVNGFYAIDIKQKSGKVTSESNPQGGGFNNVFTGVVNSNMDRFAFIARTINNVDTVWLISDGSDDGYYVIYDPQFAPEFALSADTGDTPDSDRGFTLTVTASPSRYPLAKWHGVVPTATDGDEEIGEKAQV